jgi:hypothetical protein
MNKTTFQHRQRSIRERENVLHSETNKLLYDILSNMTEEQRVTLKGFYLDNEQRVESVVNNEGFIVASYTGSLFDEKPYYMDIEDMTQSEQRDVIDHVLDEIFV